LGSAGKRWVFATIFVWGMFIAVGLLILLRYSNTPSASASPPKEWPATASVAPSARRSTLLMFVHPQCPCSRASLGELARIIACCKDSITTTVFFSVPDQVPVGFERGDLWDSATSIPGVRVVVDKDAASAKQFGAKTSGQALLYDSRGRLVFSGGITAFRGHSGDNDGRDAVVALLSGQKPKHSRTPVFGCALFGES
jgi:hypothetical protein